MNYKMLGCKIFEREIASIIYNCKNVIDVTMLRQKLHEKPKRLCQMLQEEIDLIDANEHRYSQDTTNTDYDAILLAFGLCSGVTTGLSSRRYPIVIPRVHDCIALLMGDRGQFDEFYFKNPGTFYSSCGFTEAAYFYNEEQWNRRFQMYLNRYHGNERRARKAVQIEADFMNSYQKLAYIGWDDLPFPEYEKQNQAIAKARGWSYQKINGKNTLLKQLVDGHWPEESFLVVRPGYCAVESGAQNIFIEQQAPVRNPYV